jgi:hypothetical protein
MKDELRLTRDEMRELGYRAADTVAEHFETLRSRSAASPNRRAGSS